ncbi:MAG: glycosyltransferase family 2 protein, partial [Chloroflexota bacterium]
KLLSICIPTYNRAGDLREALDSILAQVHDNGNVEVIVSDNGSSDDTERLANSYARVYPSIRYARNEHNIGFDANILRCVDLAEGDYISLFSDDDIAPPGLFAAIMAEITTQRPTVLYVNHHQFLDGDPCKPLPDKLPAVDIRFNNGKEFFLFAGLGFISSLTFRTVCARKYTREVQVGPMQAHLDIAARIALGSEGPFYFLGTHSVAARIPVRPGYDWLTSAGIAEAMFYHRLEGEGLIDSASVRRKVSTSIRHNILRFVLVKKCIGDHRQLSKQIPLLFATYATYSSFYIWILPVLVMPRCLLVGPYRALRGLLRFARRLRYG